MYPILSPVSITSLTLCDPIDSSLPGSSIHGIFQATILEWVAISLLIEIAHLPMDSPPGGSQVAQWVKIRPAKESTFRWHGSDPWVGKIPWRRAWKPSLVFLSGESHGQRSLGGYSPYRCKKPDMTEQLGVDAHINSKNNKLLGSTYCIRTHTFQKF